MIKSILLFFLLFSINNNDNRNFILKDNCDLVEINHYFDSKCEPVFDQLIFYDWSNQRKRYDVRAWRLIKSESQLPRRKINSVDNYVYLVRWHDDGTLREVSTKYKIETWTQHDPELTEREFLPQDQRIDLKPNSVQSSFLQNVREACSRIFSV